MKVGFAIPASATILANVSSNSSSVTASSEEWLTAGGAASAAYGTSKSTVFRMQIDGTVTNSSTPGNLQLQFEAVTAGETYSIYAHSPGFAIRQN